MVIFIFSKDEGMIAMLYWNQLLNPKRRRETSSVEKTKSDTRTPFKKDFDTICNSTVLRRLQDKAQVFPLEQEDYARTRLTHSIEVLSIAESLGVQALNIIHDPENACFLEKSPSGKKPLYIPEIPPYLRTRNPINKIPYINEIPTILMSAALLHDMGNPPFGHLGEQIINDWFNNNWSTLNIPLTGSQMDDLLNFDGNAQLLRLVTRLSYVVDENGMNLSYPVMASIIKYPCSSSEIDRSKLSKKKVGYFVTEKEVFNDIVTSLGLRTSNGVCRHPLAFLLEAADDIAYLSADIEDACHKGVLTLEELQAALEECNKEYLKKQGSSDPIIEQVVNSIDRYKAIASENGYPNVSDYVIHRLRILIKGIMIDAMSDAFAKLYKEIMNGSCEQELIDASSVNNLAKVLRKIESDKIHYCTEIVESKTRAIVILNKLLSLYVQSILAYNPAKDYKKDTEENLLYLSLSENYRYLCEKAIASETDEKTIIYNKLRLVIDQISGMTDSRAMSIYQRLSAT